jgi:RNA polymerase sigma-70 factor, ECF subfamily
MSSQSYTLEPHFKDVQCVPDNQDLDRFLASVERSGLRMAQLATRNADDAFDLVQDAMIKLVQKYSKKPAEEWRPLFYRILQSRITDYHRKNSLTRRIFSWFDDEDEEKDSAVDMAGPAEVLAEQLTLESLVEGLHNLPARQQQVFLLRIWEGFSVTETASIMKCGEGSVKTHLSRAVAALKKAIADD